MKLEKTSTFGFLRHLFGWNIGLHQHTAVGDHFRNWFLIVKYLLEGQDMCF